MKIDRWTLEILVNGRPLKEYEIPDPVLGISASSSLKSYVVEGRRKKFCNSAMFVAVPALGTSYNIKISPSTTSDIAARVFVDGLSDGFFTRKCNAAYTIKGFYNRNATMMHEFYFDKTDWVETTHVQTSKFGGYGAISVYYYKIQHIYESPLEYNSERMFEEVKIPETKKSFDVALTTKFSSGIESHFSGPWEVVITENDPIAVLHINYRSIDWFYIKGISIENSMQVIASTSTSTDIKNEDKTSVIQTVKKNKKKKNYQEFIVILDSDDDECKREVMELD
ncbi:hypothetical protein RclHR1_18800003 [Rhizophagus clarus]|uniref:DUF7918 domain-containing protein n=1 Tax=Rhizophagus clarus TaxID=94130 RepID=A0A2Z6RGA6_9GLOM|nr:hypothetical protein RclHR1_18800003 [Rhizophagus clarus]